jgi:hypothetical protein
MTNERMPFAGEYEPKGINKGVKLKNKQNNVAHTQVEFEQRAKEFMSDKQERNKTVLSLAQEFMTLIRDRTLPQNKSVMAKDIEQQTVVKLANAALIINQDDSEAEGMGSIAMINLLFKVVLAQRDKLNELEYELAQLKKLSRAQQTVPENVK